ncbi:MAG: 4-hydroxy-tetrahydrodipicolinate synthase [Cyclobacteriaceae bacterium]|nr:4-hydroxy-tetrahydrodipicolinate synthase [Cyclobacteriaceae bacterium]
MKELEGLGVALVTPFNENGSIDFNGLERLLEHTYKGGVDYWVVMGSTGEAATLSEKEQVEILSFVTHHNPGNLPIVFGIGGNNTQLLVQRLKETDLSGVTAVLSSSPAYNKPSQLGIIAHFKELADNSPKPILLYNVPGRTSSNMLAKTTIELSLHPNIIGIKEASADLLQILEIAESTSDDFLVTSGDDLLTPAITSIGGKGLISVMANAKPNEFKRMVHSALDGDFATSRRIASSLLQLNSLMYKEGNPAGVKELLNQMNICKNHVRLPLVPASDSLSKEIASAAKK